MAENNNFSELQFGVELEMVIRPNQKCQKRLVKYFGFNNTSEGHRPIIQGGHRDENRIAICAFLYKALNKNELPVNVPESMKLDDANPDYTNWTISEDLSIQEQDLDYGVELSSPIYQATDVQNWLADLEKVFAVVRKFFDICTTAESSCSTQVHISAVSGFDLEQIRRLSQGVFLFQDVLSSLVPLGNRFSRPVPLPLVHYALVQNMSKTDILTAMNPPQRPANLSYSVDWDRKYVAWNFLPLNTLGTIEYRQGLFSRTPLDVVKWITVALSAVHVFLDAELNTIQQRVGRHGLLAYPTLAKAYLILGSRLFTEINHDLEIPEGFLD